jgi:hypothetical protein
MTKFPIGHSRMLYMVVFFEDTRPISRLFLLTRISEDACPKGIFYTYYRWPVSRDSMRHEQRGEGDADQFDG